MVVSSLSVLLLVCCLFVFSVVSGSGVCMFDAIYQFGDSLSDTGNLILQNPNTLISHFPYGKTFFQYPTGRSSNGLLIVDYFALAAGLPFLNPYLNKEASFVNGANFAVSGATALPSNLLSQKHIFSLLTNVSLITQLHWMSTLLNSTSDQTITDSHTKLKNALFFVGEIGGNDYNYAFLESKTILDVRSMVPEVVQTIKYVVTKLIEFGANQVIVPGIFPLGCLPIYLTGLQTNDSTAYEKFHCLKHVNGIIRYHNNKLKQAIKLLKKENPNVTIAYGDYYNAFMWILRHGSSYGFEYTSLQKSCCGIGGDYNFNIMRMCGLAKVPSCSNPNKYVHWDGIHLTQKAYQYMTYWLIHDLSRNLPCVV